MFTADPEKLKCWHAGKMSEQDIKLMQTFMKLKWLVWLPEEAKNRGFNVELRYDRGSYEFGTQIASHVG